MPISPESLRAPALIGTALLAIGSLVVTETINNQSITDIKTTHTPNTEDKNTLTIGKSTIGINSCVGIKVIPVLQSCQLDENFKPVIDSTTTSEPATTTTTVIIAPPPSMVPSASESTPSISQTPQQIAAKEVTPTDFAQWSKVNICEEGGKWNVRGSVYSGGLGISNVNWVIYGGTFFALNASEATPAEQIVIAKRIQRNPPDQHGCSGSW